METARQHPIALNKPAVDFFEGAVLGNGGMGVVVRTFPDGVAFHFGHNNVWDIRIAENNRNKIGTFDAIMKKVKALSPNLRTITDDDEFWKYLHMTAENYRKPYPRPFPCGTVLLGFDRGDAELLGHSLDIADGLCRVFLKHKGETCTLEVFADMEKDILWYRLVNERGEGMPSVFNRFRVIPDPQTPQEFPRYEVAESESLLGFRQVLPYEEPARYNKDKGHPKDKAFRLDARLSLPLTGGIRYNTLGIADSLRKLEKYIVRNETPFVGCVALTEGAAAGVKGGAALPAAAPQAWDEARQRAVASWERYWQLSGVRLEDKELEGIWYRNHYFLNCATREGAVCPGLFANWSLGNIGTAWHGDYHMNYNTQQPFWLPFSSNRLDKNLPYVDMVYQILPVSRQWAKEYYGMRGAFFPHSAYPVDMTLHPYPVPDWGWEVFETPWSVQGLWWHYLYSMDEDFLRNRAFEPIKDAVLFLVDYMKRPDAHGASWGDNKYHIFPSVPPELYGLQPGFKFNYDTQVDIALTSFIFKAFIEAVDALNYSRQEADLLKDVKDILANMPDYSTTESEQYGTIYTSVPGENDRMVYNCPANLMVVFPGEQYGLDAPKDVYDKLVNTFRAHRNEGGNDIVFLNLQAARLGVLDVERFKRQVNYATLPNGTTTDMVMQTGGRYADLGDYAFMAPMGIWFENFSLPLVINECMMQSYNRRIRLFPNWDRQSDASFNTLRAAGAFLVSCTLSGGEITRLSIVSEKGKPCSVVNPWGASQVKLFRNGKQAETLEGEILNFETDINERIELVGKS
ncbi:MAG: alpha-L-fucosidase/glycosyl hydrolase family 95 [Bacteroidales bacterium]